MFRVFIAAIVAAVALMAWGFYFWMYSPFPAEAMKPMPEELIPHFTSLKEGNLESGYYLHPYPDQAVMSGNDSAAKEAFSAAHKAGPLVQLIYLHEGKDPMSSEVMALGFAHQVVSCFLLGLVLWFALPATSGFFTRWLFITLVAIFATTALQLREYVWYHHPWKPVLVIASFDLVNWIVAGFVLSLIIRPNRGD